MVWSVAKSEIIRKTFVLNYLHWDGGGGNVNSNYSLFLNITAILNWLEYRN